MNVVLARWEGSAVAETVPPLHWTTSVLDGVEEPMVCCGNGHLAFVSGHDVDGDGNISPSILCRTPVDGGECGWHVFARMEGWSGGARQARS